jgi:hypothetical protein
MAAPGYNVGNGMAGTPQNLTSTLQTIARLLCPASGMKRFFVWEIEVSQSGVPNATDCDVEYSLVYCDATGAGTKTNVTPFPTSGALAVDTAVTAAAANYTAEPTTYAQADEFWHKAVNQRGSSLWQAAPYGEIYLPATASAGPGLRAKSPNYAGTVLANMKFSEI